MHEKNVLNPSLTAFRETNLGHPNVDPTMRSLMLRTFVGYARLCRFFGCLYISNINDKTLKTSKASWKSLYTLYALAWQVMLVIFEGYSILNKIGCDDGWNCSFGKFLGTLSHSVCVFKVFWSVVCLARGSTKILKFLRDAGNYEVSSSFQAPRKSVVIDRSFSVMLRIALTVSLVVTTSLIIYAHYESFSSLRKNWHPIFKFLTIWSTVTLLFYESLMYVSVTCFCEVLLRYLKAQVTALKKLLAANASRVALRDAAARIEAIRVNICTIMELKNIVNEVWCPALVASSASLMVLTCVALYRSFTELHPEAMVANSYAAFCFLCFVDMVLVSDDLGKEAKKLKDALKSMRMTDETDAYYCQVKYLHDAVDPDDMCLTAGRFFRLDGRLLVAMAGSVITFTVILVQTSGDLKHTMGPRA
ncbi:hypothetical protein MTO96_012423 [Rhipicephalus appendiculatus]